MGALHRYDPKKLRPGRGILLVEVVEKLGGHTEGGLFLPSAYQDKHDKDLCYSRILKVGPPPSWRYGVKGDLIGFPSDAEDPGTAFWRHGGTEWPVEFMPAKAGDMVLHPRDVPMVFVWEIEGEFDRDGAPLMGRFALIYLHEAVAVLDDFDPKQFRQVCYQKSALEGL